MKQEPVKILKLPKYAAVLATLSISAGMLTGCGNTDDDPPVLAGDVAVYSEVDSDAAGSAE